LVVVQSREDHEQVARVRLCRRSKLAYLGNGITMARFLEPVTPALPNGRPVVLMVSRLVSEKGCRDFFRIAEALSDQADFVHVGPAEPDQHDRISETEIEALRANRTVSFVGPVDDVRPYVASAAIVVLPSYREGIPRAAMEAAAMGRPVAAYDIRGTREVIPPATGLLARRGDISALTEVVRGLLEDPDRRTELGTECQKRVVEYFGEDQVVERLRGIYERLGVHA
jgi:glycosyltransferase involved in cell wall biosynthesis